MKRLLLIFLCLLPVQAIFAARTDKPKNNLTSVEEKRKRELMKRLSKDFDREELNQIFYDSRLELITAAAPASQPQPKPTKPKKSRGNPYLAPGFGLLTKASLERCKVFYLANEKAFNAAEEKRKVPKEVICGIFRIETNFGVPTKKSPHPLGKDLVVNSLYSLYVRNQKKREFAFNELKHFLRIAGKLGWDVFEIRGSGTGAIGLGQFEPSSYDNPNLVEDGNADGKIDLFVPADAIPSTAKYLEASGWSDDPQDQLDALLKYIKDSA